MTYLRILLLCCVALIAACGGDKQQPETQGSAPTAGPALVVTSNYPLYYFATRITQSVGGAPNIVLPDMDGDPAFWIPTGDQVQQLQSADVIVLNGAGAESWLDLVTLDQRRLLDTSEGFAEQLIPLEEAVAHQHGPEGEHSHQGTAFTTWLDPRLAVRQAGAIADAITELAPEGEAQIRDNLGTLEQDLLELDAQLVTAFDQLDGRPILFSHPVYQYLQRRYGINGKSVHWEPDEEPSTSAWIDLQQILRAHRATTMIWEERPLESTGGGLGNMGIKPAVFHTVANRPGEGDYLSVMRANAERMANAL